MSASFATELFRPLQEAQRYQLTGIVEMARLSVTERRVVTNAVDPQRWPLLQQAQFSNLREVGPWLFAPRPGASLAGQHDFFANLNRMAGDAVCGWIVSALPPAELAQHLSHANTISAPDGERYLLRYHTEHSLTCLHACRDLPGVAQWLAPIKDWWFPAANPSRKTWQRLTGYDRSPLTPALGIELDQACWEALAGDPLSHRLADQLQAPLSAAGQQSCHGVRLGVVQRHLAKARELGLKRQADLIDYVTCMALEGDVLVNLPAWQEALLEARTEGRRLLVAFQAYQYQNSF
ncbi:DUF4123 domain-containing protein [Pseudomonas sp. MAFF212428]|uniref:DUF4123 domain-containing protein n=1 Tax=Pseudomonas brassicae TaxID=2708063 RepID=A0A6B3NSU9_9PSED|nr:DUF4123 domain-containing protein [Pseudomonas brassicae]NER59572.1 DUF4123 domain-containing protein [Pseudomonas brassicae]NER63360.1 DUF4123 domain-containing protein [Pseudomonas brassicae]